MPRVRPLRVSGMVLGPRPVGSGHAVIQIPVHIIGPAGTLQVLPLAGDAVIFGVCDAVEGLGVAVTALAQRLAITGDGEVQPSAGPHG